jgi:predicted nucleic acid-binding protein
VAKIFIDTNILIYTLDSNEPKKQKKARKILKIVIDQHTPVLSTQVLQEFYVAATRKLRVKPIIAKDILHGFSNMEIVEIGTSIIDQGIDISIMHNVSFWDSLIIAAAEQAHCSAIYSEDFNHGQTIRGISLENPL